MKYSIIIPAHSEGKTLGKHVAEFIGQLSPSVANILLEIIIVENGSKDDTLEVCSGLKNEFPALVRVLSNDRPSYGEAIKRGMIECRGTHLSVLESDCMDVKFVESSISLFQSSRAQLILASKRHPDSIDARPLKRRVLTWAFNRILNVTIGYPGSDTHGLKSLDAELAKDLCRLSITTDEVFQTEIVLIAWRLGKNIEELPVYIEEHRAPSISVVQRVPKVLNLLAELRRSLKRFPAETSERSAAPYPGFFPKK